MKDEELELLAARIQEGSDSIEVPEDFVVEPAAKELPAKNLHAQIKALNVPERLKLALKGNRDARNILIHDGNRLVQRFVLQNPRLTDDEVIAIAKNRSVEREMLEVIAKKKEWITNYQVRVALVTNPKTPIAVAMRYVPTLMARDLRQLAKSKNVASAVNGMAKRLVVTREGG